MSHVEQFTAHMLEHGLASNNPINADGELHRFHVEGDKKGTQNGYYTMHLDNIPAGSFGSWKEGVTHTWCSKAKNDVSPLEWQQHQQRMKAAKAKADKERAEKNAQAAVAAKARLDKAMPCTEHGYLAKKGVKPYGVMVLDSTLLIPMRDANGAIHSLQRIYEQDGTYQKRFFSGGATQGHYFTIGKLGAELLICEGYATGASLHEVTGHAVAVAFSGGNLQAVAEALHSKYSDLAITICADNDLSSKENKGFEYGTAAAQAVGAKLVVPTFTTGKGSDFNDLHQTEGAQAVLDCFANADKPEQANAPAADTGLFKLTKRGVFYTGDDDWLFICSPLEVTAATRDQHNGAWGRLLEWQDMDGHPHQWAMPMEMLSGDGQDMRKSLLDGGLQSIGGGKAKGFLTQYLSSTTPNVRARCVERIGWHGESFVLPDVTIGGGDNEKVIFQSAQTGANDFKTQGTLDDWQREVAAYCVGNSRLVFAVSMAFAAPLLGVTGSEGGGFNFRGKSSEGKSTTQRVAASVCGARDYMKSWRATSNGLESVAVTRNDSLFILDEMGQVAPKEAGEIAYMLANGMGKQRMTRTTSARHTATWQTLFLSSGEISLAQHIESTGGKAKAGQEVRLADIPMNTGKHGGFEELHGLDGGKGLADHLNAKTNEVYGTPIRLFLEALQGKRDTVKPIIDNLTKAFMTSLELNNADGQVLRVAQRFALVAVGGELASIFGVTGWEDGEASNAAKVCFKAWLEERGTVGSKEDENAYKACVSFFQKHGDSRFKKLNSDNERAVINQAGFMDCGDEGHVYLVYPNTFNKEVCEGVPPKTLLSMLTQRDLLVQNGGNPVFQKRINGSKSPVRFYAIKGDIING